MVCLESTPDYIVLMNLPAYSERSSQNQFCFRHAFEGPAGAKFNASNHNTIGQLLRFCALRPPSLCCTGETRGMPLHVSRKEDYQTSEYVRHGRAEPAPKSVQNADLS
jgi:hypothetical protein